MGKWRDSPGRTMKAYAEVVSPAAVEYRYFKEFTQYNAIWDMTASPDGIVYIGLCNEGKPGLSAQMYAYDTRSKVLRRLFGADEATHDDITQGHIPQSKFHTSMGVGKDGRLYAPTHTTAPALGNDIIDLVQAYDDRRRAFPGSHYLVYDPKTDTVHDMGIPIPYDDIYGGILDPQREIHYLQTVFSGHLYAVDCHSGRPRDLGRVNQGGQCCLFMDRKSRIFGTEADGPLWRYDPDRDKIDFLSVKMPRPQERAHLITSLQHGSWGPDGKYYATALYEGRLWRYDPFDGREGRFEDLGMGWGPHRPEREKQGLLWGGIFAPDGFLYYGFASHDHDPASAYFDLRIIRYDIKKHTRENLGAIHHRGTSSLLFGSGCLGPDGKIYWGDGCGTHPARLVVFDPSKAKPITGKRRRVALTPLAKGQSSAGAAQQRAAIEKQQRSAQYGIDEDRIELIRIYRNVLPAGSCELTALAQLRGVVFACASGRTCHLLRVTDNRAAPIPAGRWGRSDKWQVTSDSRFHVQVLYTIQRAGSLPALVHDNGKLWTAFNPAENSSGRSFLLCVHEQTGTATRIELPRGVRSVVNLVKAKSGQLVFATTDGKFLRYDMRKGKFRILATVKDRKFSPAMCVDGHGCIWGAVEEGFLFKLDPQKPELEILQSRIPASKGSHYAAIWQSAAGGYGRPIFGGTSEGFLFRLNTRTGQTINLGKPGLPVGLRALTLGSDGEIFGVVGERGALARLFRYTSNDGFKDLGRPVLHRKAVWRGQSFASAVATPDGRIYFGEADTQAHLWVYCT